MRFLFALILSFAFVAPVSAAPEKPQAKQSQLDKWFGELAKAETEEDAEAVRKKIYAVFTQSGSASIDLLMVRATAAFGKAAIHQQLVRPHLRHHRARPMSRSGVNICGSTSGFVAPGPYQR